MAEEFQECEVMFQQEHVLEVKETIQGGNDLVSVEFKNSNNNNGRGAKRKKLMKSNKKDNEKASSLPLKIPDRNRWFDEYVVYDDHQDRGDGEFVPPHLIVRQRLAGEVMGFSVCIGKGRTLKGRDLRQVRNSILRMTGFLES